MSLDTISLSMIEPVINGAHVLCLGVPDMPVSHSYGTFHAYALDLGAVVIDTVDVIAHKGYEEIVDLNMPHAWERSYGLVINPGTLEHCFNIGQAWRTAWDAVALGGWMVSVAPVTLLNHGYWNVNPIAFTDWCEANGGRVKRAVCAINGHPETVVNASEIPDSRSGRGCFPPETVAYVLMRKDKLINCTRWPAQGVYR